MAQRFLFIALAVFMASCASSVPYSIDYPLTKEVFFSRDNGISGQVPAGWFPSVVDTLPALIQVWLMKEDYSASFSIEELYLDPLSSQRVEKEGNDLLAQFSLAFRLRQSPDAAMNSEPKEYKLQGKEFCGYEIREGNERQRVVVFSSKRKYYECVAVSVTRNYSDEEFQRLCTAQQTILSSLSFK